MATTQKYFKGERLAIAGTLKEGDVLVSGKTLIARITRKSGSYSTKLGDLTFETQADGSYYLEIDTKKYNGQLTVRIYIQEDTGFIVASNSVLTINVEDL